MTAVVPPPERVTTEPEDSVSAGNGAAAGSAVLRIGEGLVSVAAAVVCVALTKSVAIDPLVRVGQISGLASLGLHHVLLGLVVLASVGAATKWASARSAHTAAALGCAATAGLVSGFTAGGLVLALRGTSSALYGGDTERIAEWARQALAGGEFPVGYPPLVLHLITGLAQVTGTDPMPVYKIVQIGGTALFGPMAYLAWRLVLRPQWALVMTLAAAIPLLDLYKPYANVVLVVLLPLLIHLLRALRDAQERAWGALLVHGLVVGAVLGALFITYPGWFQWTAPGVLAALLVTVRWRAGPARPVGLLAATTVGFLLVAADYLVDVLRALGSTVDRYQGIDTVTDPAYIAMWRGDLPDAVGPWPPPGELAGMGLFSALAVLGLGLALALGRRRVDVLLLAACLAGAWLARFVLASRMYATGEVQLYPRTTVEIFYCLLALGVLGVMLATTRGRQLYREWRADRGEHGERDERATSTVIPVLAAAMLACLFMGSATTDRYMPRADGSTGSLSYRAHHEREYDGRCPAPWAAPGQCVQNTQQAETASRTR